MLSKEYIPDFNNTMQIEELKEFLLKEFSNTNTSNKLNIAFFINNNYIKEIDKKESNIFLTNNHLDGEVESDIYIGLFDLNNVLLQVLQANKIKNIL